MAVISALQPGHFMDKHCSWPLWTNAIDRHGSFEKCMPGFGLARKLFLLCQRVRTSIKRKGLSILPVNSAGHAVMAPPAEQAIQATLAGKASK
jgi:hypothetical protein